MAKNMRSAALGTRSLTQLSVGVEEIAADAIQDESCQARATVRRGIEGATRVTVYTRYCVRSGAKQWQLSNEGLLRACSGNPTFSRARDQRLRVKQCVDKSYSSMK